MLHTLDALTGDDFEAVNVSSLMVSSNSGRAKLRLTRWRPALGDTLQIQYTGALDFTKNVDIYNLDMFDTTVNQVNRLRYKGRKTMCYINAGKPAFAVEYTDTGINFNQFCQQAASLGLSGLLKNRDLDAYLRLARDRNSRVLQISSLIPHTPRIPSLRAS